MEGHVLSKHISWKAKGLERRKKGEGQILHAADQKDVAKHKSFREDKTGPGVASMPGDKLRGGAQGGGRKTTA